MICLPLNHQALAKRIFSPCERIFFPLVQSKDKNYKTSEKKLQKDGVSMQLICGYIPTLYSLSCININNYYVCPLHMTISNIYTNQVGALQYCAFNITNCLFSAYPFISKKANTISI